MRNAMNSLRDKKQKLEQEVERLKKTKPSQRQIIAGEYKMAAGGINPIGVKRVLKRLDKQMTHITNATLHQKAKSDMSLSKATTRIYAHQIAHAKNPAYLAYKVHKLAQWRHRLSKDISGLKRSAHIQGDTAAQEAHLEKMLQS